MSLTLSCRFQAREETEPEKPDITFTNKKHATLTQRREILYWDHCRAKKKRDGMDFVNGQTARGPGNELGRLISLGFPKSWICGFRRPWKGCLIIRRFGRWLGIPRDDGLNLGKGWHGLRRLVWQWWLGDTRKLHQKYWHWRTRKKEFKTQISVLETANLKKRIRQYLFHNFSSLIPTNFQNNQVEKLAQSHCTSPTRWSFVSKPTSSYKPIWQKL
jgi:hypothetical protein